MFVACVSSAFCQNINLFDDKEAEMQVTTKTASSDANNVDQAATPDAEVIIIPHRASRRMEAAKSPDDMLNSAMDEQ